MTTPKKSAKKGAIDEQNRDRITADENAFESISKKKNFDDDDDDFDMPLDDLDNFDNFDADEDDDNY